MTEEPEDLDGRLSKPLEVLHTRLNAHFTRLRAERAQRDPARQVFAIEHGLTPAELDLLAGEIRTAIKAGKAPSDHWLPFIVYCVEIGYSYVGDEYWQTFEVETHGWREHGDRHIVRDLFKLFATTYGGAEPAGRWAEHFSIIAWPPTHAILPKDLQQQLAQPFVPLSAEPHRRRITRSCGAWATTGGQNGAHQLTVQELRTEYRASRPGVRSALRRERGKR